MGKSKETFVMALALIQTKNVLGQQEQVRIYNSDQAVDLEALEKELGRTPEFMRVLIPKVMMEPSI